MSETEAWRVGVLDEHTAGTGLFQGVRCAFAVADYWTYGCFEPRDHCELPGLLLRTRASADAPHVFFAPGFEGEPYRYGPSELPAYVSWTVELPPARGTAGRPALVMPRPGPWEVWAEPRRDRVDWHLRARHRGRQIHRTLSGPLGDKHTPASPSTGIGCFSPTAIFPNWRGCGGSRSSPATSTSASRPCRWSGSTARWGRTRTRGCRCGRHQLTMCMRRWVIEPSWVRA